MNFNHSLDWQCLPQALWISLWQLQMATVRKDRLPHYCRWQWRCETIELWTAASNRHWSYCCPSYIINSSLVRAKRRRRELRRRFLRWKWAWQCGNCSRRWHSQRWLDFWLIWYVTFVRTAYTETSLEFDIFCLRSRFFCCVSNDRTVFSLWLSVEYT